jgi:uncharacterized membrane protein
VTHYSRSWEWVLVALGLVAIVFILADVAGPTRSAITLAACLLLPGWSIVRYLRVDDVPTRLCLTLGASVSIAALIGLVMVWTHFWYPIPAGVVLLLASAASLALSIDRSSSDVSDVAHHEQHRKL